MNANYKELLIKSITIYSLSELVAPPQRIYQQTRDTSNEFSYNELVKVEGFR